MCYPTPVKEFMSNVVPGFLCEAIPNELHLQCLTIPAVVGRKRLP